VQLLADSSFSEIVLSLLRRRHDSGFLLPSDVFRRLLSHRSGLKLITKFTTDIFKYLPRYSIYLFEFVFKKLKFTDDYDTFNPILIWLG
jgi:hypothetical protein